MATVAENMPARLAQSAYRLFAERGLDRVSLDEISTAAGVTKGSLYWHFNSKREVILAACAHYYRTYQSRVHHEAAQERDPVARLERILRFSVRSCLLDEGNRVFTMEIFRLAVHDAEIRRGWQQFYDSVRTFYIGLVEAARAAGGVEVADAGRAVEFMLATMEGIKLQAMFDPHRCSAASEKAIRLNLKKTLGFPDRKS